MNPAVIPNEKPCDTEGKRFVPKAINISFKHPQHGDVVWSAEENDMNTDFMTWSSLGPGMFATDEKSVKGTVYGMINTHHDATFETNCPRWRKHAAEAIKERD